MCCACLRPERAAHFGMQVSLIHSLILAAMLQRVKAQEEDEDLEENSALWIGPNRPLKGGRKKERM